MYMHYLNEFNDKKCVGLPAVYTISNSTEPQNDKWPTTVYESYKSRRKNPIDSKRHL